MRSKHRVIDIPQGGGKLLTCTPHTLLAVSFFQGNFDEVRRCIIIGFRVWLSSFYEYNGNVIAEVIVSSCFKLIFAYFFSFLYLLIDNQSN